MRTPSFDNWTIIFLLFAGIAFLLSAFFFVRKSERRTANSLIGAYLLLYGLMMVEYVLFWTGYLRLYPHWSNVSGGFAYLFGPLLLYYFYAVYENKKPDRYFILHLVLFFCYMMLTASFYVQPGAEKLSHRFSPLVAYTFSASPWLQILSMSAYAFAIAFYIKRQPSVGEVRTWSRLVLLYFILFIAGTLAYYILVRFPGFKPEWDYFISFIISAGVLSTAWFALAWPSVFSGYSLKESILSIETVAARAPAHSYTREAAESAERANDVHKTSFRKTETPKEISSVSQDDNEFIKYKNSGLTGSAAGELAAQLSGLMEKENLFCENDLKLEILAQRLGTNRHHLSQVINSHFGMNFFDYVNSLRVKEACRLLRENPKSELNAIEIAYMVGFNNKVTFTAAFRKFTGATPAAYRNRFS